MQSDTDTDQQTAGLGGKGESEIQEAFQTHCLTSHRRQQTAQLAPRAAAGLGEDASVQKCSQGLGKDKNNCPQHGL